jgi:hypothetical protein
MPLRPKEPHVSWRLLWQSWNDIHIGKNLIFTIIFHLRPKQELNIESIVCFENPCNEESKLVNCARFIDNQYF